jgi:precorrin-6B methylase 1
MNTIIDQGSTLLQEQMPPEKEIINYKSSQQLRLSAMHKQTQDITLYTEEGDKVTISSLSQFQARYMMFDYSALVKEKAVSFQAEKLNASGKNAFQITVEGDLNQEEQDDIEKVMQRLDTLMQDLISGDLEGLMERAASIIDDTDSITGLDAVLQFEQRLAMEQRSITRLTHPGNGRYHPHQPGTGSLYKNPNELFSKFAAKITGQLTEMIEESKIEAADLKEPVNRLFSDILAKLSPGTPGDMLKSQLVEQVHSYLQDLVQV